MSSDSKATANVGPTTQAQEGNGNGVRALEEAISGINSVLAREGEELSEKDLAKVLKQLEAAEGVADDVEGKLDELLKNLGGMLEGLEAGKGGGQGTTPGGKQH
ncbi:hypothetical protein RSOL_518330 [Rhizoctonia solani AG-3 Rhs1AP]|uniref:Uncharacterized protein n=2 Tax=Rhizoctonia solani AG-3 TaxID=1086053 RepID=A0A074SWE9_9AGAM|nr:hypothetical protein RSOL_518330 [Rhizoctonia solani AG-3 Rhs1AP]KEP54212.1 hypothetical protein V565_020180 [Rhizoctonia solani 123E]